MKTIQKHLNDCLEIEQEDRKDRERSGKWSPSSLGRCYRLQFWNRKNEPVTNPSDIPSVKRMQLGTLIHEWIQEKFPEEQVEIEVDYKDIFGYADIVDENCVTDIKSISAWGYKWIEKEGVDIKKDKKPNWLQVATYAIALDKPKVRLFFVNISDINKATEFVLDTSEFVEDLKEEFNTLRKYWEADELPPAIPRAYGGKDCDYCSWKDKCNALEGVKK